MTIMPSRAELEWWQRIVGAKPDGKPGPETFARTIAYLRALERDDEQPTSPGTPDAIATADARAARRAAIVAWAEARVGELDPLDVWRVVCPSLAYPAARSTISWCGGFALLAWRSCLPACSAWVWRPGTGFVYNYGVHTVPLPEPGDIRVSKWTEDGASVVWHYSIVVRVNGNGTVDTIDGNTMRAPREGVTRRTVALLREGVTYYSAAAYL